VGHEGEPGHQGECGCGTRHLSSRQIDVLQLLARGLCSSEIARKLGISPRTVDDHVRVMRQHAGAADRVELVARCYAAEVLLLGWPPRWSGKRCMQVREQPGCPAEDDIVFRTRSAKRLPDTGGMSENSAGVRFPYASGGPEYAAGPRRSVQAFALPAGTGVLIGYVQASSRGQDGHDLARQIRALAAAGCTAIFADNNGDRTEFLRFLESARSGDTLVIRSLDRLADSLRSLILLVADLECRGVGLKSLREGLDTTKPEGQLIVRAFGVLAEFVREVSAERTRYGLAAARARGAVGGRPTVMTPDKIAAARALLRDNTVTAIARHVGVSRSTLYAHMELIRG
jgi:DNA invertase Pin-like site-specific DNA recombinase/DNA-binding CsgD family transcriptional regulator